MRLTLVPPHLVVPRGSILDDVLACRGEFESNRHTAVFTMGDSSACNSEDGHWPILKGTVIHIRVPDDRVFICGSEPLSVPAMVEALKLFIAEASTAIFELEIEKKS